MDDWSRVDKCRQKIQVQSGRKEEALDGIRMKQAELDQIDRSLAFFEEQFNAVQRGLQVPLVIEASQNIL